MMFDVVMLPTGKSEYDAGVDDVALLTVEGQTSLDARWDPEVRRVLKQGFYVCEITENGRPSMVTMRIKDRARRALDASERPPGYECAESAHQRRPGPFFQR